MSAGQLMGAGAMLAAGFGFYTWVNDKNSSAHQDAPTSQGVQRRMTLGQDGGRVPRRRSTLDALAEPAIVKEDAEAAHARMLHYDNQAFGGEAPK